MLSTNLNIYQKNKTSTLYIIKKITAYLLIMCLFCLTLVGCGEIHAKHSIEGKGFETIHLDTLEFHGTKSEFMEEVKPPEPVEYYNYFEPHSGYQYFVISGTLKNNGDSQVLPDNCKITALCGNTVKDGRMVVLNQEKSNFVDTIQAGEESQCYIMVLLKDEEPQPSNITFYYNQNFSKAENNSFDYEYICQL